MTQYEYKVIPAPAKGRKAPGIKTPEARFAFGLQEAMNELAAQGWAYVRSDLLPSEERQGLTSSQTVYRSVLVFRRPRSEGIVETPDEQVDSAPQPAVSDAETSDWVEPEVSEDIPDEPAPEVDPVPPRLA